MTVGHIFTKIANFIENGQIFMLLNYNCAKLANFEDFKTCLKGGGRFFLHTVYKRCSKRPSPALTLAVSRCCQ